MANIIEIKNVDKSYGKKIKTQVLFDLNLDIEEHSFNSIIGQSGSGKSTLLNLLGLLDKPDTGEIVINGTNIKDLNTNQMAALRNQTIGFIFQFHYLLPEYTALENVLLPYKISKKKVTQKVLDYANYLLKVVGLEKYKNNLANNLSGGQQQRVSIARSLINKPSLVLADEPTGNLDSKTTEQIYDLLRQINKEFKTTFIIITHDRTVAEKTDRIVEIKDGKINLDIRRENQ